MSLVQNWQGGGGDETHYSLIQRITTSDSLVVSVCPLVSNLGEEGAAISPGWGKQTTLDGSSLTRDLHNWFPLLPATAAAGATHVIFELHKR